MTRFFWEGYDLLGAYIVRYRVRVDHSTGFLLLAGKALELATASVSAVSAHARAQARCSWQGKLSVLSMCCDVACVCGRRHGAHGRLWRGGAHTGAHVEGDVHRRHGAGLYLAS